MASFMFCVLLLVVVAQTNSLTLPQYITSHAVLQADNPTVFGWTESPFTEISAKFSTGETLSATSNAENLFRLVFPPQEPSYQPVSITISGDSQEIVLEDILFGDVFVCSGQSNMEFTLPVMFDGQEIISQASYEYIRLLTVMKNNSEGVPMNNTIEIDQPWTSATNMTLCGAKYFPQSDFCEPHCGPSASVHSYLRPTWGYFSAVCFLHGVHVWNAAKRPLGLIATSWGGTDIETWSGPTAIKQCYNDTSDASQLWFSMIYPFLLFPIKGVVWYQGEANAAKPPSNYACQMVALIEDWRREWSYANTLSNRNFTFVLAQLAAWSGPTTLPEFRIAQNAALSLPAVGISIGIDLSDPSSPCGDVHIRNKTAVGQRLALWTLYHAYARSDLFPSGPVVESISIQGESLVLSFRPLPPGPLSFRAIEQTTNPESEGFEILTDGTWVSASAAISSSGSEVIVSIGSAGSDLQGVRYAAANVPNSTLLYDASLLPAGPFVANCSSQGCTLFTFT